MEQASQVSTLGSLNRLFASPASLLALGLRRDATAAAMRFSLRSNKSPWPSLERGNIRIRQRTSRLPCRNGTNRMPLRSRIN